MITKDNFSFLSVKIVGNEPKQKLQLSYILLRQQKVFTGTKQCDIYHAHQENISLKPFANPTQRWPYIHTLLIVWELLLKIANSEEKFIGSEANPEQKGRRNLALCSGCAHARYGPQIIDKFFIAGFHMTSLKFKLQNYWSSWYFTFMMYKSNWKLIFMQNSASNEFLVLW